jgi:Ca-activated chloride channel family protein
MGGMGYGGMGGRLSKADEEAKKARNTIRQVANRTFYLRQGQWIDSKLTAEQQKDPKRIKQFSDEYFALAKKYGRKVSQFMVFDDPVLLDVDGQAYLIEPVQQRGG